MRYHALLVPADSAKPAEVHEIDASDFEALSTLVFGSPGYTFDAVTFANEGFQLLVDDEGWYAPEVLENERATRLMRQHGRYGTLVGNAIVVGVDPHQGEMTDLHTSIVVEVASMSLALPPA